MREALSGHLYTPPHTRDYRYCDKNIERTLDSERKTNLVPRPSIGYEPGGLCRRKVLVSVER